MVTIAYKELNAVAKIRKMKVTKECLKMNY